MMTRDTAAAARQPRLETLEYTLRTLRLQARELERSLAATDEVVAVWLLTVAMVIGAAVAGKRPGRKGLARG